MFSPNICILIQIGSFIHVIATFGGSMFLDRKLMMSISDYFNNPYLKENDLIQIVRNQTMIDFKFYFVAKNFIHLKKNLLSSEFSK